MELFKWFSLCLMVFSNTAYDFDPVSECDADHLEVGVVFELIVLYSHDAQVTDHACRNVISDLYPFIYRVSFS